MYLVDDIESNVAEDDEDTQVFSYLASEGYPDDEEYLGLLEETQHAMLAYKAARRRLDGIRKARGFTPVRGVERAVKNFKRKGKGKGKRRAKGKFGRKGKGANLPPGLPGFPP